MATKFRRIGHQLHIKDIPDGTILHDEHGGFLKKISSPLESTNNADEWVTYWRGHKIDLSSCKFTGEGEGAIAGTGLMWKRARIFLNISSTTAAPTLTHPMSALAPSGMNILDIDYTSSFGLISSPQTKTISDLPDITEWQRVPVQAHTNTYTAYIQVLPRHTNSTPTVSVLFGRAYYGNKANSYSSSQTTYLQVYVTFILGPQVGSYTDFKW